MEATYVRFIESKAIEVSSNRKIGCTCNMNSVKTGIRRRRRRRKRVIRGRN